MHRGPYWHTSEGVQLDAGVPRGSRWTGLGDGDGRLRGCLAEVTADGRGEAAMPVTRRLWLPAEDGSVTVAALVDIPVTDTSAAESARGLRAVSAGADAPG